MKLELPAGGLVVLVGPSGSGKSTFAARHFPADAVLSSDAFRGLVAGDEADQSATARAFALLHAALEERMAHGDLAVVDATSVQRWARERLLALARAHGRPAAVVVLNLPLTVCLARNAERPDRRVPESVIRRQLRAMRDSLHSLADEGFDPVIILTQEAVASVELAWHNETPRRNSPRLSDLAAVDPATRTLDAIS